MRAAGLPEPVKGAEGPDVGAVPRNTMPGAEATADSEDLMNTLPWWVSRGLLYVLAGFMFCSLIWASCARVDEVASARGSIIPEGEVRPMQALEAGTVTAVYVHEGDDVSKGQTLVQLDDSLLQAKKSETEREYEGAQVNMITLRDSGADVSAINDAETRITELKNELDSDQLAIDRTHLLAPIAGTVTNMSVHGAGPVVQQGDVVASIAPQGARLVAELHIPNSNIAKVKPGLPVKLLIDAYPYQQYGVFDGTVMSVSPDAINTPTGDSYFRAIVVPTTIRLDTGVKLSAGLALEGRIVTDHRTALELFLDPFKHTGGS